MTSNKSNEVTSDKDFVQRKEMLKKFGLSSTERWTNINDFIIYFRPTSGISLEDRDEALAYFAPTEDNFPITESIDGDITINNYRSSMHELLYIEEMICYEQLAKYNAPTTVRIVRSLPCISETNPEKFSTNGELFAIIFFDENISEDSPAGRLLLNNCTTVLVGDSKKVSKRKEKNRSLYLYETVIEGVGRNFVYLRLSAKTVVHLALERKDKSIRDKKLEIQFQLNRDLFCKWHQAIDNIHNLEIIFPELSLVIKSPNVNKKEWTDDDSKLSDKQKEAIAAITLPRNSTLLPVLIIGPFGTGKTHTLAQAIKHILLEKDSKILICTCSNSAADLYVEKYLHPYVESGNKEATPLRIYHREHQVPILHSTVLKYCLTDDQNDRKTFKIPTTEDILKRRVIVSTLNAISYLLNTRISQQAGNFTHILIDEAAEALECETLMALVLANEKTRIVLAGDLVQSTPEVFSSFVREKKFHISLLQRLHEKYPSAYPRIILNENYRSHKAIVEFSSNIFYGKELISVAEQTDHNKFYPLNFFSVEGRDVHVQFGTGFCNYDEVEELVKRVIELKNDWLSSWGEFNEHSIAVLTPYQDQTECIRLKLMEYKLSNIVVENIFNVQGKQFRGVFLSTVRTGCTCMSETESKNASLKDYGFLSNEKILNVALTRAQSLVAVVGDPVCLCTFGRGRHIWKKYIEVCSMNRGLHGIELQELKNRLRDIEQQKTATANPSQLPYSQSTPLLGSPIFQTPTNSPLYSPIIQTPFVPPNIMPTNQTSQRPMMDFVPQFQPNSMVYPQRNNMPFAGVSNDVSNVPSNSTWITSSQSMVPNSPANWNATEAMFHSSGGNLSADAGSSAIQNRMPKNWYSRTIGTDGFMPKSMDEMEPTVQKQCDQLLAKAIISSESPFSIVENQYFKSFLQNLQPSYKILDEESLRKTHLDREFDEMNAHLKEKLTNVRNIGIRIDSWNYLRNEVIINVILTTPEPILYKCIRVTENEHIEEHSMIINIIKEIGPERVFAVVCQNASNARKFEKMLSGKFPHITTMHCLAHTLNSIITFMLEKCSTIRTIREQCSQIVNVMTKSTLWYPMFTEIKKNESWSYESALVLPVTAQIETLIECFESIMKNESVLQTLMQSESVQDVIEDTKLTSSGDEYWDFLNEVIHFRPILIGDAFWNRLNSTYGILWPIVQWILKLEKDECLISDAVYVFNEIKDQLKIIETNPNNCIPIEERNAIIKYTDERREEALGGIHFAAYLLNPANTVDYEKLDSVMSAEEIEAAIRFISDMSRHELLNFQSDEIIHDEISQYLTKVGPWEDESLWEDFNYQDFESLWENFNYQDFDPICWWKKFCNDTALSKIATRILELPVTSAAPERSFSEISMKRNRLTGDDAAKVTYIAHNLKLIAHTKSKYESAEEEAVFDAEIADWVYESAEEEEVFDAEIADWVYSLTSDDTH